VPGERDGAASPAHARASAARADDPGACPTCRRGSAARGEPAYPFCSERCRLIDLGRWLDGDYAIPALDDAGAPGSDDET
jgi:endogenous inhibitor of DNA gyrase (YacG/DUF329 family)